MGHVLLVYKDWSEQKFLSKYSKVLKKKINPGSWFSKFSRLVRLVNLVDLVNQTAMII